MSFASRTSNDGVNWSGWQSFTPGQAIASPLAQYIQFKVDYTAPLATNGAASYTPSLNSISITANRNLTPLNNAYAAFAGTGFDATSSSNQSYLQGVINNANIISNDITKGNPRDIKRKCKSDQRKCKRNSYTGHRFCDKYCKRRNN